MSAAKILLIEDDQLLRELYAQALEQSNLAVLAAADAQTGLDLLDEYAADVIVLDLMLPAHGGVEVLHELQSHPDWQSIPVIVISAVNKARVPAGLAELGAKIYLDKADTSPQELTQAVKSLL